MENVIETLKKTIHSNRNIFINVLGAFFVKGASMLLSLFLLPAYIKFFGNQNVLGVWYTILSVLNWVLMFDLGIGNGLRNKLPEAINDKDTVGAKKLISSTYISTIALVACIAVVGSILIHCLNWNAILNISETDLSRTALTTAMQIAFIGIVVQFILKLITSILYAIQKSALVNFLTLISNIIIFIAISILPATDNETGLITISYINIFAVNLPLLITTFILFSGSFKAYRPSLHFFDLDITKDVLRIGVTLLWLQLVFMIISSTNEFLISSFSGPANVVEYQIYFKIFNSTAAICSLALIPIWSAVTKAKVEQRYSWIEKTYKVLLLFSFVVLVIEIGISFFLQPIVNIWLKDNAIPINPVYALILAFSSFIFVVHNVNTSIGNGMSFFKPQMVLMTFAAIVDIPLAWLLVKLTGGWIGVVLANIIALTPFEIAQPIFLIRHLNTLKKKSIENTNQ